MDKKDFKNSKDNEPIEIPNPKDDGNTIKGKKAVTEETKHRERMKGVKFAYVFALLLAFGGAMFAKISTEKALGNIVPPERTAVTIEEMEITTKKATEPTEPPEYQVRQNLTNVPDTREITILTTEKVTKEESPYAIPYKDYYELPIGKDILNDYSPDAPIYNPTTNDWRTHNGIDFSGAQGAQVKAIAYGVVNKVYDDPLYGTVAEIDHGNGVVAKYCGFNKDVMEIKAGDKVKQGALLGYLGQIPLEKTELSHLHFEIYYKNKIVDPLDLMGK